MRFVRSKIDNIGRDFNFLTKLSNKNTINAIIIFENDTLFAIIIQTY